MNIHDDYSSMYRVNKVQINVYILYIASELANILS